MTGARQQREGAKHGPGDRVLLVAYPGLRARGYLQMMLAAGVAPDHVLLLGRQAADVTDPRWGRAPADAFDPALSLRATLARAGLASSEIAAADVNDPAVVTAVARRRADVAVFSGGGVLRAEALAAARRWLHVHPGPLPQLRGSTCIFYSLLLTGALGATAFFMQPQLDSGPILVRRRFAAPCGIDPRDLDFVYDAWIRAVVLVEALQQLGAAGGHAPAAQDQGAGRTFTVIHPVLKHLAVARLPRVRAAGIEPRPAEESAPCP
jgi:methionyl-tRNA formyltransferase